LGKFSTQGEQCKEGKNDKNVTAKNQFSEKKGTFRSQDQQAERPTTAAVQLLVDEREIHVSQSPVR